MQANLRPGAVVMAISTNEDNLITGVRLPNKPPTVTADWKTERMRVQRERAIEKAAERAESNRIARMKPEPVKVPTPTRPVVPPAPQRVIEWEDDDNGGNDR